MCSAPGSHIKVPPRVTPGTPPGHACSESSPCSWELSLSLPMGQLNKMRNLHLYALPPFLTLFRRKVFGIAFVRKVTGKLELLSVIGPKQNGRLSLPSSCF